jgi:hypothetical protein
MEGRPWAEWKASKVASPKPITKNQLAQMLKPFRIISDSVRIGDHTPKGYRLHQFTEAFERYLDPEGVSETQHRNKPTAAGTSATFRNATDTPDVADEKCEKPLGPSDCCGVAVGKGDNGPTRANGGPFGGDAPGLSWRAIDQLARETEEWAYARRDRGDIAVEELEAEIHRRLTAAGIFPGAIEIEAERVMQCLFEGQEAQRHHHRAEPH